MPELHIPAEIWLSKGALPAAVLGACMYHGPISSWIVAHLEPDASFDTQQGGAAQRIRESPMLSPPLNHVPNTQKPFRLRCM